jgi:hypothetical protein
MGAVSGALFHFFVIPTKAGIQQLDHRSRFPDVSLRQRRSAQV